MEAHAVVVHHIPGRARFLIHEKRGDERYFSDAAKSLGRFEKVKSTRVNATTGSITVEFAGDLQELVQEAAAQDLFVLSEAESAQRSSVFSKSTAPPINIVSGREITPMFMWGSVLIVLGLMQIFRGRLLPPALSIFWSALYAFQQSER